MYNPYHLNPYIKFFEVQNLVKLIYFELNLLLNWLNIQMGSDSQTRN